MFRKKRENVHIWTIRLYLEYTFISGRYSRVVINKTRRVVEGVRMSKRVG